MRHREPTEEQRKYKAFDRHRQIAIKIIITFLVSILVCFVAALRRAEEDPTLLLLFSGILVAYSIITIFVCRYFARKHGELYTAAYGSDSDIIHTGLFGEIWQEFEWNQFEGLTDGKVVFSETHNNTIEMEIIRHKHEFNIEIDKDGVYMVMDEETDIPVEKEIPLVEMNEVGQVFTAIREFVESV